MSDPQAPIKGSWEAVLLEAERLAHSLDEAAAPLYEKIFNRLGRLPEPQRLAGDGYLQGIWMEAAAGLASMYAMSLRTDDVVTLIDRVLQEEIDEEDYREWGHLAVRVLVQGGRGDEAVEQAWGDVHDTLDAMAWSALFRALFRLRRFDELAEALDDLHASYAEMREEGADEEDIAFLHVLEYATRADLACLHRDWDAAQRWREKARSVDKRWESIHSGIYVRMVYAGAYAEALALTRRAPQHEVRAGLWRGIALRHLDREEEALDLWRQVSEVEREALEDDPTGASVEDYLLLFLYGSDAEGLGLSIILDMLSGMAEPDYLQFALAGLGWGVRNHAENALMNFRLALRAARSVGQGPLLPYTLWFHCTELLSPELLERVRPLFETIYFADETAAGEAAAAGSATDDLTAQGV